MSQENDNYEPFGPEWEKEMMKLPKKFIINMLRKSQLKLKEHEEKDEPRNIEGSLQKPQS